MTDRAPGVWVYFKRRWIFVERRDGRWFCPQDGHWIDGELTYPINANGPRLIENADGGRELAADA